MSSRDRRGEPRTSASGRVRFRAEGVAEWTSSGALLDVSRHGFRASHDRSDLTTGRIVLFEHGKLQGRAQVVWTRIAGPRVETGFRYVDSMGQ